MIIQANLNTDIAHQLDRIAMAKHRLKELVDKVQGECAHEVVTDTPYKSLSYLSPLRAARICNHCRLEEEGTHWSGGSVWSRHEDGPTVLGNSPDRLVLSEASRDKFYAMRVR